MKKRVALLLCLIFTLTPLLSACQTMTGEECCAAFLEHIIAGEYEQAYEYLSASVKNDTEEEKNKRITKEAFVKRYNAIFDVLQIDDISYNITDVQEGDLISVISYELRYHSTLAGTMEYNFRMGVMREEGAWKVKWKPSLIFPDMEWGDAVRVATLNAVRGEIIADAIPLAQNVHAVSVTVMPSKLETPELTVGNLAALLNMSRESIQKKLDNAYNDFVILKQFYPDQLDELTQEQLLTLPGVGIDTRNYGILRYYPEGSMLAHIVGYVGYANESDIEFFEKRSPGAKDIYTTDSRVGKLGLERYYEEKLRGEDGERIFIADSQGGTRAVLYDKPARDGADIQLTINYDLQSRVEELLSFVLYGDNTAGAVVVIDPSTGAIEAMASYPAYDLNKFTRGITQEDYQALLNQPNTPLFNRLTQGLYPPGSIFKPFTAAMALENNVMDTEFVFDGEIVDDKWRPTEFGSWEGPAITRTTMRNRTEPLNMHNAIINSDNIYFAYTALKTGKDIFMTFAKHIGLGEQFPFDLPVAMSQLYSDDDDFNLLRLADSGYGQGQMLVTPVQMATTFSAFANGGNAMLPHLINGLYDASDRDYACIDRWDPSVWKSSVVKPETLATLEPMLEHVVSREYNGTGRKLNVSSCTIAGKTGTAEVGDDKSREISWFVGFRTCAEGEEVSPRLVLVMLEVPVGDAYSSLKFDIARELLKKSAP